ncbi:MAG: type II secretion system protein [Planctomycetota bacterium]|jgi:prepilin-type N-terminal cleavage/methylation domain-containing protein
MRPHPRPKSSKAFTLIEILVVVVILGILAGTVIAQFRDVSVDAEQTAFIASGRNFVGAAQRYQLDYGMYPNAASDRLPVGFGDYTSSRAARRSAASGTRRTTPSASWGPCRSSSPIRVPSGTTRT